jgi:hypothetical protein
LRYYSFVLFNKREVYKELHTKLAESFRLIVTHFQSFITSFTDYRLDFCQTGTIDAAGLCAAISAQSKAGSASYPIVLRHAVRFDYIYFYFAPA